MDRFNRHEFWGMLKVFVWDILIKRLVLVCLPLEMALWVTGKDGPISTLYPTHIAPWLPDSSSWLFWLAPPHFLAAIQWLIYIVYMFFLGRQLLNIYFSDIILRSCMQKRVVGVHRDNKPITSPSCITCYSRKIIWRLRDHGAMVVHLVLGSILFQTLPYYLEGCPVEVWWLLQSYWRGFLYYQYVFTRDGCCPEGMVYAYRYVPIWWAAFQVGAFDTTMDLICDLWIPSKTLYWFIMILVIIASLDALGLPIVSDILNDIFLYIPNVVAAIIVLILGILFANLLSAVVRTAASNAGLTTAEALGKVTFYAIIFFSGAIALIQLGIGEEIVAAAFGIVFGAAALALALAFGLGGKDVAADHLKKWFEKKTPAKQ